MLCPRTAVRETSTSTTRYSTRFQPGSSGSEESVQRLLYVTSDLGPQLLAGSSGEQKENLGVTTPDYYFYLNQSGSYTVEDVNDTKEFSDTMVTAPLVKAGGGACRCPLLAASRIPQK